MIVKASTGNPQSEAKTKLLKKLIVSVIRDGFQQLRMDDIARHMDVSRATMYKHFSSKEEVIDGVVQIVVDYIEQLAEEDKYGEEAYFGVRFQQLFEQSVSLIEYVTDVFIKDLQSAYPDLLNVLKGTLGIREQQLLRFYRLGKDKHIFNPINEHFIFLQDDLLLREITSVKYLLNHHVTIQQVLFDYYQFKKYQLFTPDKISLADDEQMVPIIERLAEKFNRSLA
jgi:AcrR family transcriptional regulator